MKATDEMVTRFLQWRLPKTFRPDSGVSFTPSENPLLWPTGTNLLTAPETQAMLDHVLETIPLPARPSCIQELDSEMKEIGGASGVLTAETWDAILKYIEALEGK